MLKRLLIVGLVLFVVAAAGASAYNTGVFAALGGPQPVADGGPVQAAVLAPAGAAGIQGQGPARMSTGEAQSNPGQGVQQQDRLQDPAQYTAEAAGQAANIGAIGQGRASQGGGRGYRGGNQGNAASPETARYGTGVQQAELPAWETYHGIVQSVETTGFSLLADDGQVLWVDSGNQYFVQELGMNLRPGAALSVTGYWIEDTFAAGQILTDPEAGLYQLRDEYGRPLWAGGPRNN